MKNGHATSILPAVKRRKRQGGFKAKKVKPVPDGYSTATSHLVVKGAAKAIDFYKAAFALNHAVAIALSEAIADGLSIIDRLGESGELDEYALYHAARTDLLRRAGRHSGAPASYERR